MKKIALGMFLFLAAAGFAGNFVLENQSTYPSQASKMAIQWANSAKEVQENNQAMLLNQSLNPSTMQILSQTGKINVSIPENAEYFRILVWTKKETEPDLITNWVDAVPNKTYTLQTDHLVPAVLMVGVGC